MKKLLATVAVSLIATSAFAGAKHHGGHHGHGHWEQRYGHWEWVIPAVIGGVIVYQATRPAVVIQEPAPVPNCSPWTEVQNPDGTITRTRTCTQ